MTLTYTPATPADVDELVMRPEDSAEIELWGVEQATAVVESIEDSRQAVTVRDSAGRVVCIYGYSSPTALVHPWMLSSALVAEHPHAALRMGRWMVDFFANSDKLVCNWVGKEAHRNRAFITALGFVIVPTPGSPFDFFFLPKNVP